MRHSRNHEAFDLALVILVVLALPLALVHLMRLPTICYLPAMMVELVLIADLLGK